METLIRVNTCDPHSVLCVISFSRMSQHRFSYCNQLNGLGCSDAQSGRKGGEGGEVEGEKEE